MNGDAVASRMSPAIPLPPMPRTTTFSIWSCAGRPSTPRASRAAVSTCSGKAAVTSHIPRVSIRAITVSRLERELDALGRDLGHDALVLGGVDRLGLVDQHHRDVVTDEVLASEAGVVQEVLVQHVVEGPFVLR